MPENSDLHDTKHILEEHNKKLKHFHETSTITYVLKSQIIGSIESIYINDLINPSTVIILYNIAKKFTILFDQCRQIKYEYLRQVENKIENFEYSMIDPPIVIFNVIEDLVSLSIAAKLPKSQQQIINIFKQIGEFDTSLTTWYNLAPADTT